MIHDFLLCIILGMMVSAPIGAVGTVCLKHQLVYGRTMCILSGIACGLADACYALLAALSFTQLVDTVQNHIITLQIAGIILLASSGIFLFFDKKHHIDDFKQEQSSNHKIQKLVHLFFLTLINPATAIAVPGIMAAVGLFDEPIVHAKAVLMALGILLGTTTWWTIVSFVIPLIQHRISNAFLLKINHITGSILMISACTVLYHLLIM